MPLRAATMFASAAIGLLGCAGSGEMTPAGGEEVPRGAQRLVESRTDVLEVQCSQEPDLIEGVIGAYPAVDFAARPSAVCVLQLRGGGILDLLRINGKWTDIRRDELGYIP